MMNGRCCDGEWRVEREKTRVWLWPFETREDEVEGVWPFETLTGERSKIERNGFGRNGFGKQLNPKLKKKKKKLCHVVAGTPRDEECDPHPRYAYG